jgi:hypothetical protein
MRVFDACVNDGCHRLPAVKLHQRPTLAGIERTTILTDSENLDLSCGPRKVLDAAGRRGFPLYLCQRGPSQGRAPRPPTPPSVPALVHRRRFSRPDGLVRRGALISQPDVLSPVKSRGFLVQGSSGHECVAAFEMPSLPALSSGHLLQTFVMVQHLPYPTCLRPHHGTLTTGLIHICDALVLDPHVNGDNRPDASSRGVSGTSVLVSHRVPTGRMAIWGKAWRVCSAQDLPRTWWRPPMGGCEPMAATE